MLTWAYNSAYILHTSANKNRKKNEIQLSSQMWAFHVVFCPHYAAFQNDIIYRTDEWNSIILL